MFVFAHLSDPHLAPVPMPYPWQMLNKRFTSYLSWMFKKRHIHRPEILAALVADLKKFNLDHIAVTGDLTNIALPAEFEQARRWLESLGPSHDVSVVPGNHDACVPVRWEESLVHWKEFMSGSRDDGAVETPMSSNDDFPFVRKRGPVAFIGLTTAEPRPITGTPAAGSLGPRQIARLGSQLSRLREEGLFRVVLIHHSPGPLISHRKNLRDAEAFAETIAKSGAELVLHGHLHTSDFEEIPTPRGSVPAIGVPSASARPHADKAPARYHLCQLTGQTGDWRLAIEVREVSPDGKVSAERKFVLALSESGLKPGKRLRAAAGLDTNYLPTGDSKAGSARAPPVIQAP
jgi:3',5'-cyclic AMP phosphodiesterase CpdA